MSKTSQPKRETERSVEHDHNACIQTALSRAEKRCAEEGLGRVALIVTLACDEEKVLDTCNLCRRLPRSACYTARLLKKPTSVPEGLEAKGHDVWVEA